MVRSYEWHEGGQIRNVNVASSLLLDMLKQTAEDEPGPFSADEIFFGAKGRRIPASMVHKVISIFIEDGTIGMVEGNQRTVYLFPNPYNANQTPTT